MPAYVDIEQIMRTCANEQTRIKKEKWMRNHIIIQILFNTYE